jgi:hypothetical protein
MPEPTTPARRAALYVRVSTTDQNPTIHIEDLRRLAQQRGWEVAGEYADLGISGSKDRRSEIDRLIATGGRMLALRQVLSVEPTPRHVAELAPAVSVTVSRKLNVVVALTAGAWNGRSLFS